MRNLTTSTIFCVLLLLITCGCQTKYVANMEETFVVIAARSPSDVAMTAPPIGAEPAVQIGAKLSTGETLTWVDGATYSKWHSEWLRSLPLSHGDPMFEDVYYPDFKNSSKGYRYTSKGEEIGVVFHVDSQLRLIAAPAGAPIYILERPLNSKDAKDFEAVLKDMKFHPGPVDGVIDAKTRAAIGFYLEYRGHEYRPLHPAISTALFSELVGRLPE